MVLYIFFASLGLLWIPQLILGTMKKKQPQNICQQTNGRIERNIYGKRCVVPQIQGFPAHPCKDGNGNSHIFMVGRIKRAIKKINRHGLFTESMFNPKVIGFQVINIYMFLNILKLSLLHCGYLTQPRKITNLQMIHDDLPIKNNDFPSLR